MHGSVERRRDGVLAWGVSEDGPAGIPSLRQRGDPVLRDGEPWTGASRLRPPVVSFKPVLLWTQIGVAIGGVFLGLTALFGDALLRGVAVVVMVTGLFFPGVKTPRGLGG